MVIPFSFAKRSCCWRNRSHLLDAGSVLYVKVYVHAVVYMHISQCGDTKPFEFKRVDVDVRHPNGRKSHPNNVQKHQHQA
jgi:hypothetical protein